MKKILLVEDDVMIASGLVYALENEGYLPTHCKDVASAYREIAANSFDLAILDMQLPDGTGVDVRRRLADTETAVIFLTVIEEEDQIVHAFEEGAADYITKPFGTSELLARIRTSIRHSNRMTIGHPLNTRPYHSHGLVLDFEKRIVSLNGNEIHLTQIEYKLLSLLAKNSGRVLTYSYIISEIWGPYADDSNNQILRVNMANIRRKIEENPAEPKYVFTEIGIGYRMLEDEM